MAEADSKPLADVLFGHNDPESNRPDVELAEAISAWFRASRGRVRDGASFGPPGAEFPIAPPRQA